MHVKQMTLRQEIGQLMMVGFLGTEPSADILYLTGSLKMRRQPFLLPFSGTRHWWRDRAMFRLLPVPTVRLFWGLYERLREQLNGLSPLEYRAEAA